jgi:hydroxymethylpyrimidine pyrophosphatase-like HAD family hydrolase
MTILGVQNKGMDHGQRPPVGFFVTDLDGTLLRSDRTVSEVDVASLHRLGDQGVVRAVATGRSIFSFGRIEVPRLPIDYVIFSTGAGIAEYSGGTILRQVNLDVAEVGRAADVLRELRLDFMIQRPIPETHIFGYAALTCSNPDFERRIELYRPFAFPLTEDVHCFGPATQLVAIVPQEQTDDALAAVREQLTGLTVIRTTSPLDGRSTWIEIFPAGVSKSFGAQWLASQLGIPNGHTLSVGNDYNDLDLLEWAQTGYVTANAPADLKRRFPTVASNNHGGVSEAIERWLDNQKLLGAPTTVHG